MTVFEREHRVRFQNQVAVESDVVAPDGLGAGDDLITFPNHRLLHVDQDPAVVV